MISTLAWMSALAIGVAATVAGAVADAPGLHMALTAANTYLGGPDIGLVTLNELAGHAERISDSVSVPVIADCDTGFGGIANVKRTIRAYERAGLAGLHIEDQFNPKRCGHLDGVQLPRPDFLLDGGGLLALFPGRIQKDFATGPASMGVPFVPELASTSIPFGAPRTLPAGPEKTAGIPPRPVQNRKPPEPHSGQPRYRGRGTPARSEGNTGGPSPAAKTNSGARQRP